MLYGLNFIGRIEPIYHQQTKNLEIKGLWLEENHNWDKKLDKAFFEYLNEFKNYLGAKEINWSCKKPSYDS